MFQQLIYVLDNFILYRFGMLNLFFPIYMAMPAYVLKFIYFLIPYTFYGDNLATIFMILNRLTAITTVLQYTKVGYNH